VGQSILLQREGHPVTFLNRYPIRFNSLSAPNLYGDITGGTTAAVVALPLALALGVASGAGATAGLIGAFVVGFFAALFGGTKTQISGPTGPMTVVMVGIITAYPGDIGFIALVVSLSGLFQIAIGWLKMGDYLTFMPSAVISGFMTGIGLVVIKLQIPFLFSPFLDAINSGGFSGLLHPTATAIPNLAIAFFAVLLHYLIRGKLSKILPAPLFALIVCVVLAIFIPNITLLDPVDQVSLTLRAPSTDLSALVEAIPLAIFLAVLGSIDSLLTSIVADNMTSTRHQSNKELVGQGIGNLFAGILGGLPGAGATMRTAINIKAGGHSARSGILHAAILCGAALSFGYLISYVPQACLAGILLKVGWDIIDWNYLKNIRKIPKEKVLILVLVAGLTVFANLITAVMVGLVIAGLVSARKLSEIQQAQIDVQQKTSRACDTLPEKLRAQDILHFEFQGSFSYASAREIMHRLSATDMGIIGVVFDFRAVTYLELSNALALLEAKKELQSHGLEIFIVPSRTGATQLLENLNFYEGLPADHILPVSSTLT
jgi:sulfate permease, SulP family